MERKQRRSNYRQTVEEILDKRDDFFKKLEWFEKRNNYIPVKYRSDEKLMHQYSEWKKKQRSWRKDKRLQRRLRKNDRRLK